MGKWEPTFLECFLFLLFALNKGISNWFGLFSSVCCRCVTKVNWLTAKVDTVGSTLETLGKFKLLLSPGKRESDYIQVHDFYSRHMRIYTTLLEEAVRWRNRSINGTDLHRCPLDHFHNAFDQPPCSLCHSQA